MTIRTALTAMNTIAPVHASSLDLLLLLRNLVQQTLAGDGGDKVVEYQQLHLTCQQSVTSEPHENTPSFACLESRYPCGEGW
jgi:hypothetical protein